jgi:hypothetical protein
MYKIIGADGQHYGPVTAEQLRQWIAEGRANAETLAQAEGGPDWKPLGQITEFAAQFPTATSAAPPSLGQPRPHVPNYLAPAILCTIFCCLPFGIPAIVFAAQVNSKLQSGNVQGAVESSRKAKTWCWIAFWLGIIPIVFWIIMMSIGAISGGMHGSWRTN